MEIKEAEKLLNEHGFILVENKCIEETIIELKDENKSKLSFKKALENVKITHKKCLDNLKDK